MIFTSIWNALYTLFPLENKPTCRRWWGFSAPPPRSEQTPFSRHLPWPSLPAHSRTPSRRRQPWYQRTPPCRPPALLIHSWMPERGCCLEAPEPLPARPQCRLRYDGGSAQWDIRDTGTRRLFLFIALIHRWLMTPVLSPSLPAYILTSSWRSAKLSCRLNIDESQWLHWRALSDMFPA